MIRAVTVAVLALAACGGGSGGRIPDLPIGAAPVTTTAPAPALPACTDVLSGKSTIVDQGRQTRVECMNGGTLVVGAGFDCPDGSFVAFNDFFIWHKGVVKPNTYPDGLVVSQVCT